MSQEAAGLLHCRPLSRLPLSSPPLPQVVVIAPPFTPGRLSLYCCFYFSRHMVIRTRAAGSGSLVNLRLSAGRASSTLRGLKDGAHCFTHSFIHSTNTHGTCSVPGPITHAEDTETNKTLSLFFRVLVQIGDEPMNSRTSKGWQKPKQRALGAGSRSYPA